MGFVIKDSWKALPTNESDDPFWTHVYPLEDLLEHKLVGHECDCEPKIDLDIMLVVHESWDGRE